MTAATIFVVVAALGALNTINGYRPFTRSGRTSVIWQMAGMLTSELPLHVLVWQVVGTLVFVWVGALESAAGIVGLVLALVSWAGLVGLHREAQRSGDVLDAVLRRDLGDVAVAGNEASITARQVVKPSRGARQRYCTTRDVAYADAGVRNQLDVWRRPDLPVDGRAPVLLQIHGGAWVTGRKDDQAGPLLTHLSERGWVCVAANYRLSPAATWPDHIVDVKRAIAWVRGNITQHGGDPSFIAITGGSAGGHLSALAALTPNDPAFQPGFEDADTTVQAAVPVYGLFDLTGRTGGTRPDTIHFLEKQVFKGPVDADASPDRPRSPRRPALLRGARRQRLVPPGGAGPHLRRGASGDVDLPGRLRRAAARPTCLRLLLLGADPSSGRRCRAVPNLGPHTVRELLSSTATNAPAPGGARHPSVNWLSSREKDTLTDKSIILTL